MFRQLCSLVPLLVTFLQSMEQQIEAAVHTLHGINSSQHDRMQASMVCSSWMRVIDDYPLPYLPPSLFNNMSNLTRSFDSGWIHSVARQRPTR